MPGIWGITSERKINHNINFPNAFHKQNNIEYLINYEKFEKAAFGRFSGKKFYHDKIFKKTEQYIICTEGIILNLKKLLTQYNLENLNDLIEVLLWSRWKNLKKALAAGR